MNTKTLLITLMMMVMVMMVSCDDPFTPLTRYVTSAPLVNGTDPTDCGQDITTPCHSIRAALAQFQKYHAPTTHTNSLILIQGEYSAIGNEQLTVDSPTSFTCRKNTTGPQLRFPCRISCTFAPATSGGFLSVKNVAGGISLSDIEVSNCQAFLGGAIYAYNTPLDVRNVFLHNNKATKNEGGAIFHEGGRLGVFDSLFESNTAKGNGGAIHALDHTADISKGQPASQISNTQFKANRGLAGGGAIASSSMFPLQIKSSVFEYNAASSGSAIFALASVVDLTQNTRVINNNASQTALYCWSPEFDGVPMFNLTAGTVVEGNLGDEDDRSNLFCHEPNRATEGCCKLVTDATIDLKASRCKCPLIGLKKAHVDPPPALWKLIVGIVVPSVLVAGCFGGFIWYSFLRPEMRKKRTYDQIIDDSEGDFLEN